MRSWWRIRQGLDQFPDPSGPYYDRWLKLNDVGDYYPWLAEQFDWSEPWASWAKEGSQAERDEPKVGDEEFRMAVSIDMRSSFTGTFLEASAIFIRRARDIEAAATTGIEDSARTEHKGLIVSSIMQCVAALETEAHEICHHGPGSYLGSNGTDLVARDFLEPLSEIVDRQSCPARFNVILHLLGKAQFDKGAEPYQSVALIVRLRDELVHYKSLWGNDMESTRLFASLKSLSHPPPPFVGQNSNFFPDKCLGAACATWALAKVIDFLEHFYQSLGVSSRFNDYKARLVP